MLSYFTILKYNLNFNELKKSIINFYKDNPSDYNQLSANCNNTV